MVFKAIAHRKIWRGFNAIVRSQHVGKILRLCLILFWAQNELRVFFLLLFIFHSVIPRRPDLNIKPSERFSRSCSADYEAIKYSENSAKPEVDFEPNRGEIVFLY